MEKENGVRVIIETRQGDKSLVFNDSLDKDCNVVINYKLRDELSQVNSHEDVVKWVKDLKEYLKECMRNYSVNIELYIDVEGIGTVWLIPTIVKATNSIYDDTMYVGVSMSLIDFDGDNYTTTQLLKY